MPASSFRRALAADGFFPYDAQEGGVERSPRKHNDPKVIMAALKDAYAAYCDPYDVDIHADPYPVYGRLREETPLYYNDRHNFYAVSRFDDVERGLVGRETFIRTRFGSTV